MLIRLNEIWSVRVTSHSVACIRSWTTRSRVLWAPIRKNEPSCMVDAPEGAVVIVLGELEPNDEPGVTRGALTAVFHRTGIHAMARANLLELSASFAKASS